MECEIFDLHLQTPLPASVQSQYQTVSQSNLLDSKATMSTGATASVPSTHKILDKKRLQDLAKEIDPMTQLDDDVEEVRVQIYANFGFQATFSSFVNCR